MAKNSEDTYKVGPLYPSDVLIDRSSVLEVRVDGGRIVLAVEEVEVLVATFLIIQPAVAWPDHTARLRTCLKLENFLFDSLQHRLGG